MNILAFFRPQPEPAPDASVIDTLTDRLSQELATNAELRAQIELLNAASISERSNHLDRMNTVMGVLELVYKGDIPAWMAIATVDKLMKEDAH